MERRKFLKTTGVGSITGIGLVSGTAAAYNDIDQLEFRVWKHASVDQALSAQTISEWEEQIDYTLELLDEYFTSIANIETTFTENAFERRDPVGSRSAPSDPDEDDIKGWLPSWTETDGWYDLVVIADTGSYMGHNRGGDLLDDGGYGYVNAIAGLTWDEFGIGKETPREYRDTLMVHEILHSCGAEHSDGNPNVNSIGSTLCSGAEPTVMATGYAWSLRDGDEDQEPSNDCEGDSWMQCGPGLPSPSLELTQCTEKAVRDHVTGWDGHDGTAVDYNNYRPF